MFLVSRIHMRRGAQALRRTWTWSFPTTWVTDRTNAIICLSHKQVPQGRPWLSCNLHKIEDLFGRMVEVAFQSVFRLKMYQSNVFFSFFKIHFWHQHIKKIQEHKKKLFSKKKISKFHETLGAPLPQTGTEIYITPWYRCFNNIHC